VLSRVSLRDARVTHRYDTFRGTTKESTARKFGVHGANFLAFRV
jgi:hypothetical protein